LQPYASGYTLRDMNRHQDDNPRWVLVEPGVVARIEGENVNGLIVYGDITAERLRSIRLSRLDHIAGTSKAGRRDPKTGVIPMPHQFPEWIQPTPPTLTEVETTSELLPKKGPGRLVPTGKKSADKKRSSYIIASTKRQKDESTESFLARFAEMYQSISPSTPSPNKIIANLSGLSDGAVKQYVHRARALGYLPMSRRSRS